ncbi:hypothetical protein P3X46_022376 [Hevea brasiliensis]|uniref:Receptor-like serine/threonine-protein kinase n=1 Tax=Hevea brasiliensis TaxID=3981 RepID=A0ABQ9L9A0_HEVBR|nr:putative receptor protein kinase ZmPK1 [Hevea brasiliensis]KAJ9162617.1 hypothetical protein P3X46_022376 [Hevea brasiliensis]
MAAPFILIVFCLITSPPSASSSSSTHHNDYITLNEGSSLSVERPDHVLISPNAIFTAGFYPVGENAYSFAIWFTEPYCSNCRTVVWMANRDAPINGRNSKLSLLKTGNLILTDAGKSVVWASNTFSLSSSSLQLYDTGNLVLITTTNRVILWQSFDAPTDTLLPLQPLNRDSLLVSSRSLTNFSSGFYKLAFDDDNVLRLVYDGPEVSSAFWPAHWLLSREAGRSSYNSSRIALLDAFGNFISSDNFTFFSADYGVQLQRRLTLDFDGNLRLYSRENENGSWVISWQAFAQPCKIHAACGPNSVCKYVPSFGRKCSCLPGYKIKNPADWSLGCEPEILVSSVETEVIFIRLPHVEMYGYDFGYFENYTLEMCKEVCLRRYDCKGFALKYVFQNHPDNVPYCFPKLQLLNGYTTPNFRGDFYLKVPKTSPYKDWSAKELTLDCPAEATKQLERRYVKTDGNRSEKFLLGFVTTVGIVEILAMVLVWLYFIVSRQKRDATSEDYFLVATGFRRFTYSELKAATRNFSEEIGRGATGIVYKGILDDQRVAAIKRLHDASEGKAEFLAEVSTVGKLNHMNLIEMWGYCADEKHRLLVYENMEKGSLAKNLSSMELDWKKRFKIALGTAKGLAYLHEECLEWVLHCDVKPQNILLDANYEPKLSDFGLSRLLSRGHELHKSSFSMIRGTRGYMAPEWIFNLPITSKVDVYSYGVVVLEMVTGRSPSMADNGGEVEHKTLVEWVKEKKHGASARSSYWVEEITNPATGTDYDRKKLEGLIGVALKCVEESKDARPTMNQVVEMLLEIENHH